MSGLSNQLMVKAESTYGTRVVPNRAWEYVAESLKRVKPRIASAGHRPGDEAVRYDHWMNGRESAAGTIEMEVANKGHGLAWDLGLGSTSSVADGAGFHYTTKLGDQFGKSMTVQVGRGDTGGPTVDPFDYVGCKVLGIAWTQALDQYLRMVLTLDAQYEDDTQSLASAVAPTVTELFHWDQMAITVNGASFKSTQADWHVITPMKVDRFFNGQTKKSEPIRNAKRDVAGTLVGEFESLTNYNLAVAALPTGSSVPIVITYTGATTYDTAKPFKLVFTFNQCRLEVDTPVSNNEDVIPQTLPFTAMQGASEVVTIDYYTSDSAI